MGISTPPLPRPASASTASRRGTGRRHESTPAAAPHLPRTKTSGSRHRAGGDRCLRFPDTKCCGSRDEQHTCPPTRCRRATGFPSSRWAVDRLSGRGPRQGASAGLGPTMRLRARAGWGLWTAKAAESAPSLSGRQSLRNSCVQSLWMHSSILSW